MKDLPMKAIFTNWFSHNHRKFKYLPGLINVSKTYDRVELWLSGDFATNLVFRMDERFHITLHVTYNHRFWDILAEFDVDVKKTELGQYYCGLCEPEYKAFYSSRSELVEKHSLNPLLDWINSNYNQSKYITLFASNGSSWTRIVNDNELENAVTNAYFIDLMKFDEIEF